MGVILPGKTVVRIILLTLQKGRLNRYENQNHHQSHRAGPRRQRLRHLHPAGLRPRRLGGQRGPDGKQPRFRSCPKRECPFQRQHAAEHRGTLHHPGSGADRGSERGPDYHGERRAADQHQQRGRLCPPGQRQKRHRHRGGGLLRQDPAGAGRTQHHK